MSHQALLLAALAVSVVMSACARPDDHDNSAGLGAGADKEYIECFVGRCLPVEGVRARYLRFHSNGCTATPVNRYTEIEVYGRAPVDRRPQDEPRVRLLIVLPKPIFT